MADILRKIVADKRVEIEALKVDRPLETFRDSLVADAGRDFRAAIARPDRVDIIAEIKRGSPSRGILSEDFNPMILAQRYRDGGAAALSVLTEQKYFFGRHEFLELAGKQAELPVLCKDFIFDPYQIYYARLMKADAVLLIVRLLPPDSLREFIEIARTIGLAALVETHNREEVQIAIDCGAEIIGVNNRDLADFTVRLETCEQLAAIIPENVVKVAESGIFTREHIERLGQSGFSSFLIGEALVRADDPVALLKELRGQ